MLTEEQVNYLREKNRNKAIDAEDRKLLYELSEEEVINLPVYSRSNKWAGKLGRAYVFKIRSASRDLLRGYLEDTNGRKYRDDWRWQIDRVFTDILGVDVPEEFKSSYDLKTLYEYLGFELEYEGDRLKAIWVPFLVDSIGVYIINKRKRGCGVHVVPPNKVKESNPLLNRTYISANEPSIKDTSHASFGKALLDLYDKDLVCDHISRITLCNCLEYLQEISQNKNIGKMYSVDSGEIPGVHFEKKSGFWRIDARPYFGCVKRFYIFLKNKKSAEVVLLWWRNEILDIDVVYKPSLSQLREALVNLNRGSVSTFCQALKSADREDLLSLVKDRLKHKNINFRRGKYEVQVHRECREDYVEFSLYCLELEKAIRIRDGIERFILGDRFVPEPFGVDWRYQTREEFLEACGPKKEYILKKEQEWHEFQERKKKLQAK